MKRKTLIALCTAALLSSCMPKLYPPQVEVPEQYLYAQGFMQDTSSIRLDWWRAFGDTRLDSLVDLALANNRDLMSAASRISQARDQLAVARAAFLPSVGLGISAEGDYNAATKITQEYAITPQLSWEVSLFGGLRNTNRAAKAAILQSQWAARGVMLSLAAEVATTYFTLLQYQRDLTIARSSYALRSESAALIDSMFRYGMSDGVALEQARSLVYTAAADIPLYERAIVQAQMSLCTLLGVNPQKPDNTIQGLELQNECYVFGIPTGVPSALLERRPDVMQAYYAMSQAAYEVGIARSARYPSILITGKGGVGAAAVEDLFSGKPWIWSAVGTLTQPLFSFGKLKRKEMAAKESYVQSAYAYEQTVLEAFADVENALTSIETYREQACRNVELVEANQRIATMTQALYKSGMSNYLSVIDAERSLYDSQMQLVNLTAQQYIACITLCKALGGGW